MEPLDWTRIVRTIDGCWEWHGGLSLNGYPMCQINKQKMMVHRLIFTLFKGQIDKGMEIDHKCCNRRCVNPSHLQQVSRVENVRLIVDRQTTCKNGLHPWPENARMRKNGSRYCLACDRERRKRGKEKAKAATCSGVPF